MGTSNMKILVNTTAVVSVVKFKPTWLLMVLPQSTSIVKSKTKSISNILPNTSHGGVQSNSIQSTIMLNHTSSGSSTAKNSTQKTKESKLFLSVFLDQCVSTVSFPTSPTTPPSNGSRMPSHSNKPPN